MMVMHVDMELRLESDEFINKIPVAVVLNEPWASIACLTIERGISDPQDQGDENGTISSDPL